MSFLFFFQAEDGIRDLYVTGVQTCALPISRWGRRSKARPEERRLRRGRLSWEWRPPPRPRRGQKGRAVGEPRPQLARPQGQSLLHGPPTQVRRRGAIAGPLLTRTVTRAGAGSAGRARWPAAARI